MSDIYVPGSTPVSIYTGDDVERVPADASLRDVAEALVAGDLGVVVVGDDARPAALVSERDLVRAAAEGKDFAMTPAASVASTHLVWCDADATVDEVASQMRDRYIRHVLVEEDGALVGIISARDLLGAYSADADIS